LLLESDSDLTVYTYCDADYCACPLTQQSLGCYYITITGSPIGWKIKKQSTVSRSSTKAEYHTMANVTSELIWIKSFLASLWLFFDKPIKLYCDNQAALHIAKSPVFS